MKTIRQRVSIRGAALLASCLSAGVLPAAAVSTEVWTREGETFRVGHFAGTIISPDGELIAGLDEQLIARPESGVVWDLLLEGETFFAAIGSRGGLLRWDGTKLAAAMVQRDASPEIFAVARGDDVLFLATGPRGAIFVADVANETMRELFRPDAEYIWDLAISPDGDLIVATGIPGRVIRLDPDVPEAAEVLWRSPERHVRTLAVRDDGVIYAGTSGSGWLAELVPGRDAYVVYDAPEQEIVDIEIARDGAIWLAAAGTGAESSKPAPSGPKSKNGELRYDVTVTPGNGNESNGANNSQAKAKSEADQKKPSRPARPGGGSVIRIDGDAPAERIWSDRKETPLSIALHPDDGVLVGMSAPARVWWFDQRGRAGLWHAFDAARAVSAIVSDAERVVVATSNPASLWQFGPEPAVVARWTSDVFDAGTRATIGRVHVVVPSRAAADVSVELRAGNTAEPGPGWTGWIPVDHGAAPPAEDGGTADVPTARFAQVRVEIDTDSSNEAAVSRITLRYRPLNRAPEIERIDVLEPGVAYRPVPPATVTSGQVPVIELGVSPEVMKQLGEREAKWRSKKRFEPGALTVTWDAADPDDDALRFRVDVCRDDGAPCRAWIELVDGLDRKFFSFDSRRLDDGVYRFRVTADDGPDNYPAERLARDITSGPVSIDHTPPVIDRFSIERLEEGGLELELTGSDPHGRLARAEVASKDGAWIPIRPKDGVEDGAREAYSGLLEAWSGESHVTIRLIDAAGNVTVERIPVDE